MAWASPVLPDTAGAGASTEAQSHQADPSPPAVDMIAPPLELTVAPPEADWPPMLHVEIVAEPGPMILDIPPPVLPEGLVGLDAVRTADDPSRPDLRGNSQTDTPIAQPDLPNLGIALPEPHVAVVEVPPPAGFDSAIAKAEIERLAEIAIHPRLGRAERTAIARFYEGRDWRPLWIADGGLNDAARNVLLRLARAEDDALDGADYGGARFAGPSGRPADLVEMEWRISAMAVAYARDARGARINPARVSPMITVKLDVPAADAVLAELAGSARPDETLRAYNPPHAGYGALRMALAELREATATIARPQRIGPGPTLRVGMSDPRVPVVRARFGLEPGRDTTYDTQLAGLVATFQKEKGLRGSGLLDQATLRALSGDTPQRAEADLIANMERWRWLPRDLGRRHVFVNLPEFQVRYMREAQPAWTARVIVGKPETPTPVFSDTMDHVVVNPSWYVPPSILKKEFLPKLAEDPGYAERRGFEVIRRGSNISIRQPPGERNALGNVKFMFPNQHAVYMHDTPSRNLFNTQRRAYSHGCVRVDQPFRFADMVLEQEEGWTGERLRRMVGSGERTVRLKNTLPVHLVYFTVHAGGDGKLGVFDDLYGYHRLLKSAMGLGG